MINRESVFLRVNSRHIGQLGRELVTDYVTALTELIKNSYDADAEAVEIIFDNVTSSNGKIYILDTGNGFTKNDIINKWAIIGTNSKVKDPFSKIYKRKCAGKKGIGRFSVERLAEYCTLFSINDADVPIKYCVNWNDFEGIDIEEFKSKMRILNIDPGNLSCIKYIKSTLEYLIRNEEIDQQDKEIISEIIPLEMNYDLFFDYQIIERIRDCVFPILLKYKDLEQQVGQIPTYLESLNIEENSFILSKLNKLYLELGIKKDKLTGTLIILEGLRDDWNNKDIQKLFKELRNLISPFQEENNFHIKLSAEEFNILDYKLTNDILSLNYAIVDAHFSNEQKCLQYELAIKDTEVKKSTIFFDDKYICGDFDIKLYFFIRDNKLKSENMKIREAKNILDSFCGVKIYRDDFRVRPYGDYGNDWLLLDYKKTKDTHGYRVGNNQLIGEIKITTENNPLLIDSTNREAIIENEAFLQLRGIVEKTIGIIETERYNKYQEELKSNKINKAEEIKLRIANKTNDKVSNIYSKVRNSLKNNDSNNISSMVDEIITVYEQERNENDRIFEDVKHHYKTLIDYGKSEIQLYKNLATLGIFAGSFGHETDSIIARMLINIDVFRFYLTDNDSLNALEQIKSDILKISNYSDMLIGYLKKSKRLYCDNLSIKNIIENIINKYKEIIKSYDVEIDATGIKDFYFSFPVMQIDIESIIINMLTNSFEALKGYKTKLIKVTTYDDYLNKKYVLEFEDSGRGIPSDKIEWIFIPLNTTKKEDGVGLGLTIVKDIVESYKGIIEVGNSLLGGAKFKISLPYIEEKHE